ncbi:Oligoribonuclease [uncultured archaeon]|nr:Oligoribonuclease [uncultured archaeon]
MRCPQCKKEGESNREDTELTCAFCGYQWSLTIPQNIPVPHPSGCSSASEHFDHFLFLDFETTGDPDQKPLEVGWMLTDRFLEPLMECQSRVIRQDRLNMNDKILKMHTKNGLLDEVVDSVLSTSLVENIICDSIQPIARDKTARIIIAGFTVHFDRDIIHRDMPQLDSWLHYRHFDVSTLRAAYHHWVEKIPSKRDQHPHRVKADVLASWEIARTFKRMFEHHMPKGLLDQGVIL